MAKMFITKIIASLGGGDVGVPDVSTFLCFLFGKYLIKKDTETNAFWNNLLT